MRYNEIIVERRDRNTGLGKIIAAAIKAKAGLSTAALDAIEQWSSTNWDTGALEMAFRNNGPLAHEITQAFEPVREVMRSTYGDTIKLYRGQRNFTNDRLTPDRVLFSWTSEPKIADHFINKPKDYTVYSDAEIAAAVAQFKRTGYCKLGNKSYKLSKEDPDYYLIYNGHNLVTDGYTADLEADLKDLQEYNVEMNISHRPNGKVVSAQISIDDIVWVDNDLDCKEFIAKVNPLSL